MKVNISEIFSSIQGEGRYAGHPAVFIRFAGCSVQCDFCDTKEAQILNPEAQFQSDNLHTYNLNRVPSNWCTVGVQEVYEYVADLIEQSGPDPKKRIQMVVITGGEPFEQPEALGELCVKLPYLTRTGVTAYMQVCVETSGSTPLEEVTHESGVTSTTAKGVLYHIYNSEYCFLTVSPKRHQLILDYAYSASQLKFLVGCTPIEDIRIPPEVLDHCTERTEGLAFQPIWYSDPELRANAVKRAIEATYKYGGTLSTQLHKFLGVR